MKYHDHDPPFRVGYGPEAEESGVERAREWTQNRTLPRSQEAWESNLADYARAQRREVVEECAKIAAEHFKSQSNYVGRFAIIGESIGRAIREHFKEE